MRRIFLLLTGLALFGMAAAVVPNAHAAAKAATSKKYRVLFQWSEVDSIGQFIMTKHTNNLLDDLGQDNVEMEVLTYGPAVMAVTQGRPQSMYAKDLDALSKRGVHIVACENAMKFFGVKKEELLPVMGTVHSAMGEIVRKHSQGWQVLRP